MLLSAHWLLEGGCLLLCLLPPMLRAQSNGDERPRSSLCQQSPTRMSCKGVGLHQFPKELGQGIRYLELSNNFIQNLSDSYVPGFGQLEHLDLSSNQLETVSDTALSGLPQLRSLLLGSNHLDRNYRANGRALRLLRNIEALDLSANNLESHMASWYISNLTTLRTLDLSGNKMVRLPAGIFWSTSRLRQLDLSNNYIMEIEEGVFEALEELEVVNLALNSLHCISGFNLRQLRVLNLSHNALELFIWEEGAEPYLLRALDLSYNRLLYFPELPKAHYLTHLNLSNNLIASLLPGSHQPREFALPYEEMLRFNGTSRTAAALTRVADLDLSNNQLQLFPFPFLRSLGSLHSLSLARNCLRDVATEPLPSSTESSVHSAAPLEHDTLSLRWLDLHDNALRVVPRWFFDSLPQLERLDLGSNSLQPCAGQGGERLSQAPAPGGTCTPFDNSPRLKHLSLRNNNITRLHPYTFNQTWLLSLDLSENEGLVVSKEALSGLEFSLQNLSLRGNQMDDSKAELPCLHALKALDLSGNNLSLLPPGVFCSQLESLDVRDNSLRTLEKLALTSWWHSLKDVSIAGNPFSCCSLAWLDALRAAGVGVRDLDQALCVYQDESRNFSTKITSSPGWLCPRPKGLGFLALLVVVLGLFFLSSGVCCLLKKGQESPGLCDNKVGVFPKCPRTEEAGEVRPTESITKV